MRWAWFEVLSGLLYTLLILMGVVLMVQFRIIRKTLRRQRISLRPEEGGGAPVVAPSPVFSSFSGNGNFAQEDGRNFEEARKWKEEREREQKRFDAAIREVEQMRSELTILISDVQRFLDDLAPIVGSPARKSAPAPPPRTERPSGPPAQEESMKDRVFRLSREGFSIAEIAADVGRGEGEVAFLLAMEKVGRS